ncbi:MAG: Tat pathway signal sequence domain protein [Opitutales bacterium]|nr:Tat pathway signal sequence domain protein [Opitutales bacterium]
MKRLLPTLLCCALAAFVFNAPVPLAAADNEVPVRWIDDAPPSQATGISWGVPWPRGEVQPDESFSLQSASGESLPLQSWPMAYWPDGTLKWTGFATVAGPDAGEELKISRGEVAEASDREVRVQRSETTFMVDTGALQARIHKWGGPLIDTLSINGRTIGRNGRLVAVSEHGVPGEVWESRSRSKYLSKVESVELEQSGPVRAVFKVEGVHRDTRGSREWLPFTVRLYFYAGESSVNVVHTFIYDGDESEDFVRGLGITFDVPMREQVHNRHVRFSGEDKGLWAEPVQPMVGRGGRFAVRPGTENEDVFPDQVEGIRVPDFEDYDLQSQGFLTDWAEWNDFKLVQPNADGFTITKRTNDQSAWIPAGAGRRSSGLAFVGDVSGGLAVSLKNFWQSYPASLEVRNATRDAAQLTVWFWSPDGPEMDMRHYDTRPHGLQAAYEDIQPGFDTPLGVARTSELMLFVSDSVPSKQQLAEKAQIGAMRPLLSATPEYLHAAGAFGVWSLPSRDTPFKEAIENRLDSLLDFYQTTVEEHRWYGFWDYGDFMHSFDFGRNVWRYDLGGMAWANSELAPDLWLWYSFLRSGRGDIFRMAEAMTRHTAEVDTYHAGPFALLGTRHNVRHWGDGAKEVRVSTSGLRRYYYYLTTDERTGDIMRNMTNAHEAIAELDPMRLAQPITERELDIAPARVRIGPDWFSLVANWMTEWERTGDDKWRDKILAGVHCLAEMPYGLRTGRNLLVGYDPETHKLYQLDDRIGSYNLATIMGGAEFIFELNQMLDDEKWHELWLRYCRLYRAPADVVARDKETNSEGEDARYGRGDRLNAYVYYKTGNEAYADAAIAYLVRRAGGDHSGGPGRVQTQRIEGPDVLNPIDIARGVNTNGSAQYSLIAIQALEMLKDLLPEELPKRE